ncbi:MAG: WxcM-like domain-containing protein [Sphingomonadaceae bacterium]
MIEGGPEAARTTIGEHVMIGANATICAGVQVGAGAEVRPGAVVMRNVPPNAIVSGNPARIEGYVDTGITDDRASERETRALGARSCSVRGVTIHELPLYEDLRGRLSVGQIEDDLPFLPKRYFLVFDVPGEEVRGEHAHLECHQFLICVRGSCAVVVDDGMARAEIRLDRPNKGLYLPPMTWGIQYRYTRDAVLLVFASHLYDPADYIRKYSDFLERKRVQIYASESE